MKHPWMQSWHFKMCYLTSRVAYPGTWQWNHQLIVSNALGDLQLSWETSFVFVWGGFFFDILVGTERGITFTYTIGYIFIFITWIILSLWLTVIGLLILCSFSVRVFDIFCVDNDVIYEDKLFYFFLFLVFALPSFLHFLSTLVWCWIGEVTSDILNFSQY